VSANGGTLSPANVYVLRNYTAEPLGEALLAAGRHRGFEVRTHFGGYGTYLQEALDPGSDLARGSHDAVLLTLWLDAVGGAFGDDGALRGDVVLGHLETAVAQVLRATSALLYLTTFVQPFRQTMGDRTAGELAKINAGVHALAARDPRTSVIDLAAMVAGLGEERVVDPRFWFLYRAPLRAECFRAWAEALAARLANARGQGRKVLVLDCDNTLWGGIVGEDGPGGIRLDPGTHPGCIFHLFQQQIVALARSGVLIAIASKNNEADVFEVLDRHPHSVLRREHLAAHRINWQSKPENLHALARDLNVGLDSFVFVDDSPMECQHVREMLPAVEVLQVPAKTYELPNLLKRYAGFATGGLTAEDRARALYYQLECEREQAATRFASVEDFLASLDLSVEVGPPRRDEMARLAQLTQRTNQFNLTTRRYTEGDVQAFLERGSAVVLALRATDRFGEYGLTGLSIAVREGDCARIDTLLLSCRVLGRRVEDVLLAETVRVVDAAWQPRVLSAEYLATAKNQQTARFYDARGFEPVATEPGRVRYERSPGGVPASPDFITVTRR
jgi:FkbH-like protein